MRCAACPVSVVADTVAATQTVVVLVQVVVTLPGGSAGLENVP